MDATILTRTSGPAVLREAKEQGITGSAAGLAVGGMPFVAGRFAVFNQWAEISSSLEGRFWETIAPGAFDRTIREDRPHMRLMFEHGHDPFIGSRPIAPIDVLGTDSVGVFYAGRLFDTVAARELKPLLQAGVLGSSFRFKVDRARVDDRPLRSDRNPERLPERTILEASVFEFGPVVFPAYRAATAGVSTGEQPPRSRPPATPGNDLIRRLVARELWLQKVLPL